MTDRTAARDLGALAALALAAALAPAAARAQFATTNVQLLQGWAFHDGLLGYDTFSGKMTTLTLNHFSTWKYGDNFAFVDLYRGEFVSGIDATLYAEWHPRLFLNRIFGAKGNVVGFRDVGIAAEVNQGHGFYAYMAGAGGDLALPIPGVVGVNLYYRHSSVQIPGIPDIIYDTWQLSPFWTIPFKLGKVSLIFTGFIDVFGVNSSKDVDVMTQPELLVDVLALAGGKAGAVYAGIEWYLHYNPNNTPQTTVSAPQAMLQWNLH